MGKHSAVVASFAALALGACNHPDPPPLAVGRCRVISYREEAPDSQECEYQGYLWTCRPEQHTCTRGPSATLEDHAPSAAPQATAPKALGDPS